MHLDVEDLQRDATAAREALRRHDPALLTLAPFAILARLVIRREPHDTSVELVALVVGHRTPRSAHFTHEGLGRRLHEDEVAHAREQIHQFVVIGPLWLAQPNPDQILVAFLTHDSPPWLVTPLAARVGSARLPM